MRILAGEGAYTYQLHSSIKSIILRLIRHQTKHQITEISKDSRKSQIKDDFKSANHSP